MAMIQVRNEWQYQGEYSHKGTQYSYVHYLGDEPEIPKHLLIKRSLTEKGKVQLSYYAPATEPVEGHQLWSLKEVHLCPNGLDTLISLYGLNEFVATIDDRTIKFVSKDSVNIDSGLYDCYLFRVPKNGGLLNKDLDFRVAWVGRDWRIWTKQADEGEYNWRDLEQARYELTLKFEQPLKDLSSEILGNQFPQALPSSASMWRSCKIILAVAGIIFVLGLLGTLVPVLMGGASAAGLASLVKGFFGLVGVSLPATLKGGALFGLAAAAEAVGVMITTLVVMIAPVIVGLFRYYREKVASTLVALKPREPLPRGEERDTLLKEDWTYQPEKSEGNTYVYAFEDNRLEVTHGEEKISYRLLTKNEAVYEETREIEGEWAKRDPVKKDRTANLVHAAEYRLGFGSTLAKRHIYSSILPKEKWEVTHRLVSRSSETGRMDYSINLVCYADQAGQLPKFEIRYSAYDNSEGITQYTFVNYRFAEGADGVESLDLEELPPMVTGMIDQLVADGELALPLNEKCWQFVEASDQLYVYSEKDQDYPRIHVTQDVDDDQPRSVKLIDSADAQPVQIDWGLLRTTGEGDCNKSVKEIHPDSMKRLAQDEAADEEEPLLHRSPLGSESSSGAAAQGTDEAPASGSSCIIS